MEKNNLDNENEKQIVALFDAKDIRFIDLEQFKKLINSGALDNEMNVYQELWLTNYVQKNKFFTVDSSEEAWNRYFYPNTNVLLNRGNLTDAMDLKRFEAISTFKKIWFLFHHDVDGEVDKQRLINIHHFIFDDVYPFAGEYRCVNMAKEKGSFLMINKKEDIDSYLDYLFFEVNLELKNCKESISQFAILLSNLYMKIIYCHPFREGNGRSTREFLRQFSIIKSKELGLGNYELDWSRIDRKQLDEFIGFAYLFPGLGSDIFLNALVKKENQKHI